MDPRPPTSASRPTGRIPSLQLGASVAASVLISLFFFTPRFILWRLLGTSETPPEVVRAGAALDQLAHPLAPMEGHTLRVMGWRLFFPILGHALHLPAVVYLALPQVGCILVLLMLVHLLRRHDFTWTEATAAAVVLATCSWFFVSAAWLAYFDSWFVLGLLVLVFFRSRWAAIAAVLVVPWIDERFVLMLPLTLLLRYRYSREFDDRPGIGPAWRESLAIGAGILPWVAIRSLASFRGSDPVTGDYLHEMQVAAGSDLLKGSWHGLRWAWVFIGLWLAGTWRAGPFRFAGWLAIFLATLAVNLVVAEDLSRSVSSMVPMVILGMIWLKRSGFRAFVPILYGVAALNVLFPAVHVIGNQSIPILYAWAEMDRNRDPLHDLNPAVYIKNAESYAHNNRPGDALHMLDIAIDLEPDNAEAYADRAVILANEGDWTDAKTAVDRAIALEGSTPELMLNRAEFEVQLHDIPDATADAAKALSLAPVNWPRRAEAEQVLGVFDQVARPGS